MGKGKRGEIHKEETESAEGRGQLTTESTEDTERTRSGRTEGSASDQRVGASGGRPARLSIGPPSVGAAGGGSLGETHRPAGHGEPEDPLDRLVAAVRAGARYRRVAAELVREIGARELVKARGFKEAVKATRNKIHQVGGVYLDAAMPYAAWLDELRAATGGRTAVGGLGDLRRPYGDDGGRPYGGGADASGDPAIVRAACARVMAHHASTRERLPILDRFYAETLAPVGPIHSVLDLACGLNPLALPWLPLAPGADYYACDVYADLVEFVGACLALPLGPGGVRGRAEVRDLVTDPPTERADLALLLKVIPCLDQVDRGAARRLLEALRVDHMLITFPPHGLGGRGTGMAAHYEARFEEIVAGMAWTVRQIAFPGELTFLVTK